MKDELRLDEVIDTWNEGPGPSDEETESLSEATAVSTALAKAQRSDNPDDMQKVLALFVEHGLKDVALAAENMSDVKELLEDLGKMARTKNFIEQGGMNLKYITNALLDVHRITEETVSHLKVLQGDTSALHDAV